MHPARVSALAVVVLLLQACGGDDKGTCRVDAIPVQAPHGWMHTFCCQEGVTADQCPEYGNETYTSGGGCSRTDYPLTCASKPDYFCRQACP